VTSTTWENWPELPEGVEPPAPKGERAWPPWIAPAALVGALAVALVGGLGVSLIGVALGHPLDEDTPPGILMAATFIQDAAFVGAAVLFARLSGPTWAAQFGLRPTRILAAIGWMVVFYVGYTTFAGLWQLVVEVEQDDVLDTLGTEESTAALVGAMVLVCVVAPVVEELFFRGFFFTALRNWKGLWPAAIGTGAVFGAIHVGGSPAGALVPLGVLGFALCLLYAQTGSLYPCIAVHAINNAIAFGVLNDWGWEIAALLAGSLAACFAVTVPVARRWRPPAPRPVAPTGPAA
jgi:hypothetical protein